MADVRSVFEAELDRPAYLLVVAGPCKTLQQAVADALQGMAPRGRIVLMGIAFDTFSVANMPMVMNSLQILGSAHTAPSI